MPNHTLIVQLHVRAGGEDEYRDWHDRHIAQILAVVPGFVAARRLELASPPGHPASGDPAPFTAHYEIDGDSGAAIDALRAAGAAGRVDPPPPGLVTASSTGLYTAAGAS